MFIHIILLLLLYTIIVIMIMVTIFISYTYSLHKVDSFTITSWLRLRFECQDPAGKYLDDARRRRKALIFGKDITRCINILTIESMTSCLRYDDMCFYTTVYKHHSKLYSIITTSLGPHHRWWFVREIIPFYGLNSG